MHLERDRHGNSSPRRRMYGSLFSGRHERFCASESHALKRDRRDFVLLVPQEGHLLMESARPNPRPLLALALVMTGCGAAAEDSSARWAGTWTGSIVTTGSCSDGSAVPTQTDAISLSLSVSGSTLRWMAGCGATALATANGNAAVVSQYTCPARMVTGGTVTLTVSGGTLVISGNALQLALQSRIVLAGTQSANCTTSSTGTLTRTSP